MKTRRFYFFGRPIPVTIVTLFVLSITAWNGFRAWVAVADWDILLHYDGNPVYTAASGLIWLIAGCVLVDGLLNRRVYAWRATLIVSMIYMIWYWTDRLFIQVSPSSNLIFSAVTSVIIFIAFAVFLFWPSSRAYFMRRNHE